MRDLLILGFIFFMLGAAMGRPFLMSMAYLYVDLVSPQRITYYLLNAIPFSLIMAVLAILFYALFDDKKDMRFGRLQVLMLIWVIWITITTLMAQLPEFAWIKWSSAWKSIGFGIFLPFVLRTRQRIEVAIFFVVLSVGVLTITGGLKTLAGGGGYGTLNILVESNSGLYEGSTIAAVAVSLIPLIMYLYKHNTLFARSKLFKLATAGLIFAALLIPIGTEARTGLICIAVLAVMVWLKSKRKVLMIVLVVGVAGASVPFLPESFTGRMSTIKSYDADQSASTRIAVWNWTLGFVKDHPLGGGFDCYRLNKLEVEIKGKGDSTKTIADQARAFHSSYFETLGGHGYPGFAIYMSLLIVALLQLRGISKRFKAADAEDAWVRDLATALAQTILIFMAGSAFVGIAFQTTLYILLALAASVAQWVMVRDEVRKRETTARPVFIPGVGFKRPLAGAAAR